MPNDNWGTPLRDVLADAEITLASSDLNEKFLAFYKADGEPYVAPYSNVNSHLSEDLSSNRIETWKRLFDNLGLLYVDEGRIRVSRFGRLFAQRWHKLRSEASEARASVARAATSVLGRYQLLNPTTKNRGYPSDCDVFPYRVIWSAISRFGDLHWEELHRVLLRVMTTADLESALNRIELARAASDYEPQNEASATLHLGPAIYGDAAQAMRRMTPWFSIAGFGGLLIDKEAEGGRRKLKTEFQPLIEEELSVDRPWMDFGTDEAAWFTHLESGLNDQATGDPKIVSEIADDDPVFKAVEDLVINDGMGGALLLGVPGTGKSWYARQIAIKLTGGDARHWREVQFHPSYQYEDFVEGYVPDPKEGFRLVNKHLLEMVELARNTEGPVVLIIDEFSRTDPSRVLGETMTYMEGSLRGVPFYLPSGRRVTIPKNLIFLATMNPDDRSVDEIDAAMDRRWAKVMLEPDPLKVRDFLTTNGAAPELRGKVIEFFMAIQNTVPVGHAFFRSVRDLVTLQRLWDTQLKFMIRKRLRFDPDTLKEAEGAWAACIDALSTKGATDVRPVIADEQVASDGA